MRQAILLGDYEEHKQIPHPVNGIDVSIREIFESDFPVEIMEDYQHLTIEKLSGCNLLICSPAPTRWQEKANPSVLSAILTYTVNGGAVLGLHSALSMTVHPEMGYLFGAFSGSHGPAGLLDYTPTKAGHLILDRGCAPFTQEEEMLPVAFDEFSKNRQILYDYPYGETRIPAAWTLEYGFGKVACTTLGSHPAALANSSSRRLIRRMGLWAADLL